MGRKKALDDSVNDYKMGLIRFKEQKKQIQFENSAFWRKQCELKQQRKDEAAAEKAAYDPE